MPRYFFDVNDGISVPDSSGTELADIATARREGIKMAGHCLAEYPDRFVSADDWSVTVRDERGLFVVVIHAISTVSPMARSLIRPIHADRFG